MWGQRAPAPSTIPAPDMPSTGAGLDSWLPLVGALGLLMLLLGLVQRRRASPTWSGSQEHEDLYELRALCVLGGLHRGAGPRPRRQEPRRRTAASVECASIYVAPP